MNLPPVRLPDWERRLAAIVNRNRTTPYAYGSFDCAVFARMAVEAVTGVELLPGVEPPKGWLGAAKFMIARGWGDVEAMATDLLGSPVPAEQARRGDIVSYADGGEMHLAVRVGDAAIAATPRGLVVVPRLHWRRTWLVGA